MHLSIVCGRLRIAVHVSTSKPSTLSSIEEQMLNRKASKKDKNHQSQQPDSFVERACPAILDLQQTTDVQRGAAKDRSPTLAKLDVGNVAARRLEFPTFH